MEPGQIHSWEVRPIHVGIHCGPLRNWAELVPSFLEKTHLSGHSGVCVRGRNATGSSFGNSTRLFSAFGARSMTGEYAVRHPPPVSYRTLDPMIHNDRIETSLQNWFELERHIRDTPKLDAYHTSAADKDPSCPNLLSVQISCLPKSLVKGENASPKPEQLAPAILCSTSCPDPPHALAQRGVGRR